MNSDSDTTEASNRGEQYAPSTTIYWDRWATILQVVVYAATLLSMLVGAGMYIWG